jgi:hypothetical protein
MERINRIVIAKLPYKIIDPRVRGVIKAPPGSRLNETTINRDESVDATIEFDVEGVYTFDGGGAFIEVLTLREIRDRFGKIGLSIEI